MCDDAPNALNAIMHVAVRTLITKWRWLINFLVTSFFAMLLNSMVCLGYAIIIYTNTPTM